MVSNADSPTVDRAGVGVLIGASVKTVDRLSRTDTSFPQPIRIGARVRYLRAEVLAWLEAKAAAGRTARPDLATA